MFTKTKIFLVQVLVLLFCSEVIAQSSFTSEGIVYNILTDSEVEVGENSYSYKNPKLTIPSTVLYNGIDYHVVKVGTLAFYNNKSIETLVIEEGVKSLDSYAFQECRSLKNIVFPKSLKSIGLAAFLNCSSIEKIIFPEGLEFIERSAFCTALKWPNSTIILPKSLKKSELWSFYGNIGNQTILNPNALYDKCFNVNSGGGIIDLKIETIGQQDVIHFFEGDGVDGLNHHYYNITGNPGLVELRITGIDDYYQTPIQRSTFISVGGYQLNISKIGYATIATECDYILPEKLMGGIVTIDKNIARVEYKYFPGDVIPAGQAILIKGCEGRYFLKLSDIKGKKIFQNALKASLKDGIIKANEGSELFVFAQGKNGLGFYYQKGSHDGSQLFNIGGKAYLELPKNISMGANGLRMVESEVTGINQVYTEDAETKIYTLTGIRLNKTIEQLTNGIYIVNGKKVVVK